MKIKINIFYRRRWFFDNGETTTKMVYKKTPNSYFYILKISEIKIWSYIFENILDFLTEENIFFIKKHTPFFCG